MLASSTNLSESMFPFAGWCFCCEAWLCKRSSSCSSETTGQRRQQQKHKLLPQFVSYLKWYFFFGWDFAGRELVSNEHWSIVLSLSLLASSSCWKASGHWWRRQEDWLSPYIVCLLYGLISFRWKSKQKVKNHIGTGLFCLFLLLQWVLFSYFTTSFVF